MDRMTTPPGVLHLVANLGAGGAERQLYLLCRETSGAVKHSVLALVGEGRWAEPLRALGVLMENLGARSLRDPRLVFRLSRRIASTAPDIVHCWLPALNVLGGWTARLLGGRRPRFVASVRNVDRWKSWAYRAAERYARPGWDVVISNSWAGSEQTEKEGVPSRMVRVVPNGVASRPAADALERAEARAKFGIAPGTFVMSTACRLVAQKRVDRFLSTAATVLRAVPRAAFLVAGDGPLARTLEAQAANLGLGARVRFLGNVADPRPVYAASDVFLLTSEREGMSNSLIEAMQCGAVPVVTPAGDNARIVTSGSDGWVADPSALAPLVIALADDPERRAAWGRRAHARASNFTTEAMAARTLDVYGDLLGLDLRRRRDDEVSATAAELSGVGEPGRIS